MKYLVSVNYMEFVFDNHSTADSFAELSKTYHNDDNGKPAKVTVEYLTDKEAAEHEKRN